MLPRTNRLSSRDISRLFGRPQTQKIISYPFVFFVGTHPRLQSTKRGIQLSTKIAKSSVKRHILKRVFYDCIEKSNITVTISIHNTYYTILAVPQKAWIDEMSQLLATSTKNTIVPVIMKQFTTSLSSFSKKLCSLLEGKKPLPHSNNARNVWKEKEKNK